MAFIWKNEMTAIEYTTSNEEQKKVLSNIPTGRFLGEFTEGDTIEEFIELDKVWIRTYEIDGREGTSFGFRVKINGQEKFVNWNKFIPLERSWTRSGSTHTLSTPGIGVAGGYREIQDALKAEYAKRKHKKCVYRRQIKSIPQERGADMVIGLGSFVFE